MSYNEEKTFHEFYVKVFPPILSTDEKVMKALEQSLLAADEETKNRRLHGTFQVKYTGKRYRWEYAIETRAAAILILGIGTAAVLVVSDSQRKKEDEKKSVRQMKLDYPKIINKFNLYIRAGMTIRRAWFLIAQDYEKKRTDYSRRKAYEEMVSVMHQISGGNTGRGVL